MERGGVFLENTTKIYQKAGQGPKLPLLTTYDLRGCEHHTPRGCQPLESLGLETESLEDTDISVSSSRGL